MPFKCDSAGLISNDLEIGKQISLLLHEYDFRGIRGNCQDHVELGMRPSRAYGLLGSQVQMVVKEVRHLFYALLLVRLLLTIFMKLLLIQIQILFI